MQSKSYPVSLLALIVFIAVVNLMAEIYYWYWRMRWFDKPMHFLGGVWLASTAIWLWYGRKGLRQSNFLKILGISLLGAFGVGLLWELLQAGLGLETVGHVSRLSSSLSDLLFDVLGGMAAAIWVWVEGRNKKLN